MDAIEVSGNFCDAHNIFAVVSASPTKLVSIAYNITKESKNATQFVATLLEHHKTLLLHDTTAAGADLTSVSESYSSSLSLSSLPELGMHLVENFSCTLMWQGRD
jgi:hypothetical protein